MSCDSFLATHLGEVITILKKPHRTPNEMNLLKYLLRIVDDLREYTKKLDESQGVSLCRAMKYCEGKANDILFKKGDVSDKFYVIIFGEV